MTDHDPILDAALDELLGGKAPPDLVTQTLARAAQPAALQPQPAASPRSFWRAWSTGLAAAALLIVAGVLAWAFVRNDDPVVFNGPKQVDQFAMSRPEYPAAPKPEDVEGIPELAGKAGGGFDAVPKETHDRPTGGVTLGGLPELESASASQNTASLQGRGSDGLRIPSPTTPVPPAVDPKPEEPHKNGFKAHGSNPFVDTEDDKLSTFALEHDTGSYTIVRDMLRVGRLPPEEAIRAEEFINYFKYGYDIPTSAPFTITMDAAPSRYGADIANCVLLRVGVQARVIDANQRKPAVLTFVVDTSGSMSGEGRIGLVKRALELLVDKLQEGDKVGIVAFGTEARLVLPHRDAGSKAAILEAIRSLEAEGSTNAGAGLKMGYQLAVEGWRENHTNRVVLCSDGVANTGVSDIDGLVKTIVENRRKGITLSSLGFGVGHMNDHLLEQLGDKGDGHYAYIDSIDEAKRVFVDNLTGALEVVGRDVKMQVEFNPRVVKSYRLIGYVNRDVKDADFRNDEVDGGEIGAGNASTALYEVKLYDNAAGAIATATVRYKADEEQKPSEITREVLTRDVTANWESASNEFRLAANVAEFAEILGKGFYAKTGSLEAVLKDLESMRFGSNEQAAELIELVKKAIELSKKD